MITAIIALVAVVVLMLIALVGFGLGSRGRPLTDVVTSFLFVLLLGGYGYLGIRILYSEWDWTDAKRALLLQLYETRDALKYPLERDEEGDLVTIPNEKSIATLKQDAARWKRALERAENWQGRHWDNAGFVFTDQAGGRPTGTITLPPVEPPPNPDGGGDEPAEQPLTQTEEQLPRPETTVYLFDAKPMEEGGRYLGGWTITGAEGRQLTVEPSTQPDQYDRAAWTNQSGTVIVYEELPADRWIAFTETPRSEKPAAERETAGDSAADLADAVTPQPRLDTDVLEKNGPISVPEKLRQQLEEHSVTLADIRKPVPQEEWDALLEQVQSGNVESLPGEYWAEVRFSDLGKMRQFLELPDLPADAGEDAPPATPWDEVLAKTRAIGKEFVDGNTPSDVSGPLVIELDLESAFQARESHDAVVEKVFKRRRLLDTGYLAAGSRTEVGGRSVILAGLPMIRSELEREIEILKESQNRLKSAEDSIRDQQNIVDNELQQLRGDLENFERDAREATRLAKGFEDELQKATRRLRDAERDLVQLGRRYDAVVREAVRNIDERLPRP